MTPKPCKWCGSVWHSKNKCQKRQNQPLPDGFMQKRPLVQVSPKKPSEGLTLAYKGRSKRSQLIGWADKYFSIYIRLKGSDGHENYCYTCGRKYPVQILQNGHFMSRRFLNTRWSELNCHPQCSECNMEKGGNLKIYEQKLRAEYGDKAIDDLKLLARSGDKITLTDIENVVNTYIGVAF